MPRVWRRYAGERTEWTPPEGGAGGEEAGRETGVAAAATEGFETVEEPTAACDRGIGLDSGGRDVGVGVDMLGRGEAAMDR